MTTNRARDGRLAGRAVMVTGAASGMGRSTAVRVAGEGASVIGVDLAADGLQETVDRVREREGEAIACITDVSSEEDVAAAMRSGREAFGRLDGVVTCAGIFHGDDLRPVADIDIEAFQHVLAVNLTGTFLVVKHALPDLVASGGGSIVTVASTAALRGHGYGSGYTASKGGVVAFTRLVAVQYGRDAVRANCICPGGVDTPMTAGTFLTPEAIERTERTVPLRRIGRPEEIAAVAAFLVSDDAAYLTGQTVTVDGGSTVR